MYQRRLALIVPMILAACGGTALEPVEGAAGSSGSSGSSGSESGGSGHGAPDASNGTPYLLPYDGNPSAVASTAVRLGDVMRRLDSSQAREAFAFIDSCFSGAGGRSVLPPGARPLVRVRQESSSGALALFAASQGNEISGPAPSGSRGLFTSVLTEALGTGAADGDGDGQISLQELEDWVKPRVTRTARSSGRDQTPVMTLGAGLGSPNAVSVGWGYPSGPSR